MHDYFRYTLLTKLHQSTLASAFNFMNLIGDQINTFRDNFLDVEYLMRSLTEIYGSQKVVAYLELNLGELDWEEDDIEEANAILAKIKNEPVVEPLTAQSSQTSFAML